MYIVIVGGGEVGYYLTRALLGQGHEVLVLERESRRTSFLGEELGDVVVRGDGCEARTLDEVGTARADVLIAVTGDDEDNLVACQVAKHRFHVPKTIARIKNPVHEMLFEKLGIDATVCSTELILAHIGMELPSHFLLPFLRLRSQGLKIVEVMIPPDSRIVGKKLSTLALPEKSLVSLVIRKDKGPQVPSGDTVIEAGDELVAVAAFGSEEKLRIALTGSQ